VFAFLLVNPQAQRMNRRGKKKFRGMKRDEV
jgi:hypothetical protein